MYSITTGACLREPSRNIVQFDFRETNLCINKVYMHVRTYVYI